MFQLPVSAVNPFVNVAKTDILMRFNCLCRLSTRIISLLVLPNSKVSIAYVGCQPDAKRANLWGKQVSIAYVGCQRIGSWGLWLNLCGFQLPMSAVNVLQLILFLERCKSFNCLCRLSTVIGILRVLHNA